MNVEESLRREIGQLRDALASFSATVTRLDVTLAKELENTRQRLDNLEKMILSFMDTWGKPSNPLSPTVINMGIAAAYAIVALLVAIVWQLANGGG